MPKHHQLGISLVEVLVSTAVVFLLVGLGLPAFGNLTHDNHRDSQLELYGRALLVAREAALSEGHGVGLCISRDAQHCLEASSGLDWQQGWLLYGDTNGNRRRDLEEPLLLTEKNHRKGNNLQIRSGSAQLYYQANGSLEAPFGFLFCDHRGIDESRSLNIGRVGRPTFAERPKDCG